MIVDSHCHAWRYWPYSPEVPDPESRPSVEQLLFEMDQCGVEEAVLVAARIEHNPDNNDYIADCVRRFPERLYQFADVDCMWTPTYHVPGAAERLAEAVRTYNLRGFTHYVDADDDGTWFFSDDGQAFLSTAARLNQIVSIHLPVHLQPALRRLAEQFPDTPFLCHHMGYPVTEQGPDGAALKDIVASARHRTSTSSCRVFTTRRRSAGSTRMPPAGTWCARCTNTSARSDSTGARTTPVRWAMTYRQALEVIRTHCAEIIPPAAMDRVLGGSLHDLLQL